MLDIVICAIPPLERKYPLIGPAILKAVLNDNGFKAKYVDFNIEYWNTVGSKEYFRTVDNITENILDIDEQCIDAWANQLIETNPTWIGISLFSYKQIPVARKLLHKIKQKSNIKTVIGGAHISIGVTFIKELQENNLIDAFISGDAEETLVELLQNNTSRTNVFKPVQLQDMNQIPIPDYSDLDLDMYEDNGILLVTGSRGCVKNCTFCNIATIWPTYRFRTGISVASELEYLNQTHGIDKFYFTDSLINGSMKAMRDWCHNIIEKNMNIKWWGQFICRPEHQMTANDYDILKQSGYSRAIIGVESGSTIVREHMTKTFTDQDLFTMLKELVQRNIDIDILMMVGYPTETEEDFQMSLQMIQTIHDQIKMNPEYTGTYNITVNNPAVIIHSTPLHQWATNNNIELKLNPDNVLSYDWEYGENTEQVRIQRYLKFDDTVKELQLEGAARWLTNGLQRKLLNYQQHNMINNT
jgi:radical SAM superfamily enzyme YgiQ (UPF0313 family)